MTAERPQSGEGFGFTEREKLYDRITDQRFQALLTDQRTAVHQIEVSTNNYGEFLFVTMSQNVGADRQFATFWGLGFVRP